MWRIQYSLQLDVICGGEAMDIQYRVILNVLCRNCSGGEDTVLEHTSPQLFTS